MAMEGKTLTLSPPIPLRLYTLPYWSNPPVLVLIFDIRALWRSGLSARAPECQKLKLALRKASFKTRVENSTRNVNKRSRSEHDDGEELGDEKYYIML